MSCENLIKYIEPFIYVLQDEQLSDQNCKRILIVLYTDLLYCCMESYAKAD